MASGSPTRAAKAHAWLETVLRTIHADVVAAACTHIAVARDRVAGGVVADPDVRVRIAGVLETLAEHAVTRTEWDPASARG